MTMRGRSAVARCYFVGMIGICDSERLVRLLCVVGFVTVHFLIGTVALWFRVVRST